MQVRKLSLLLFLLPLSCAPPVFGPAETERRPAGYYLRHAENESLPASRRGALYLHAVSRALDAAGANGEIDAARRIYNDAATGLATLIHPTGAGRFEADRLVYRLEVRRTGDPALRDPASFTSLLSPEEAKSVDLGGENRREGLGGALVGVRRTEPPEPFMPRAGVAAPLTALVRINGGDAVLELVDPDRKKSLALAGHRWSVDADFTAPLEYYPEEEEALSGLRAAMDVGDHLAEAGLYMVEPHDSRSIPVVFVHGLISTPQIWRRVINELETDPRIRERFQFGVFRYPSGNPPAYSGLLLRNELAAWRRHHPDAPGFVLIGHSMGGIVARAQATSLDRRAWERIAGDRAPRFFAKVEPGSELERAMLFRANPDVARLIFICTPHRGSELANSRLGALGRRLIALPTQIASAMTATMSDEALAFFTGDASRLPNSVTGLAPGDPFLRALDSRPIEAPHHSVIGDRGRGDTPQSSDGVVGYWSSSLSTARSEKIVPGPHGSQALPETIEELERILLLHAEGQARGE